MPSGLGAFSIDNLLGGGKNKPTSIRDSYNTNTRGCCPCPADKHVRHFQCDKCRCNCHESQRQQFSLSATFGQKERKRTTFTEVQNKGMRRIFEQQKYLDGVQRESIAKEFDLTPAQVKRKWQNFRAKQSKTSESHDFKGPVFTNQLGLQNCYNRSLSYSAAGQPYVRPISSYNSRMNNRLTTNDALHGNLYKRNLVLHSASGLGKDHFGFSSSDYKSKHSSFSPVLQLPWLS